MYKDVKSATQDGFQHVAIMVAECVSVVCSIAFSISSCVSSTHKAPTSRLGLARSEVEVTHEFESGVAGMLSFITSSGNTTELL